MVLFVVRCGHVFLLWPCGPGLALLPPLGSRRRPTLIWRWCASYRKNIDNLTMTNEKKYVRRSLWTCLLFRTILANILVRTCRCVCVWLVGSSWWEWAGSLTPCMLGWWHVYIWTPLNSKARYWGDMYLTRGSIKGSQACKSVESISSLFAARTRARPPAAIQTVDVVNVVQKQYSKT